MEEAEELSDRVGIINEGRLLAIDSVDALRSTHNLKFKATFRANSGETQTFYGRDSRELSERIRAQGVEEFSISKASLEDVYLAITGGKDILDETAT